MKKSKITKKITLNWHEAQTIRYALIRQNVIDRHTLKMLEMSRERDLTPEERWELPGQLSRNSREELIEQINPWKTLVSYNESLIEKCKLHNT